MNFHLVEPKLECALSRERIEHVIKRDISSVGLVVICHCNVQNACITSDWPIRFKEFFIDKCMW